MSFAPSARYVRTPVVCYNVCSHFQSLANVTAETIIPIFMFIFVTLNKLNNIMFEAKYKALTLVVVEEPPAEAQSEDFNDAMVFVFIYICSLIPKNPSESLLRFQANSQKGLIRALEAIGLNPQEGDYTLSLEALSSLQDFLAHNTDVLSSVFQTYLGFCNSNNRTVYYTYAMEVHGNLKYGNMLGVRLIEETLLEPKHSCISDSLVSSYLEAYMRFKNQAQERYKSDWTFTALLDKDLWLTYSRSNSFKELRIIASIYAAGDDNDYGNIKIGTETVASLAKSQKYARFYNTYGEAQGFQQVTGFGIGAERISQIRSRVNRYNEDRKIKVPASINARSEGDNDSSLS